MPAVDTATAYKTAIARVRLTLPFRWLIDHGHLAQGLRSLDYGCGRSRDADWHQADRWDPNPALGFTRPQGPYDQITCTYVLNVVDLETEKAILADIAGLLSPEGQAFITVRRDIPRAGTKSQRWAEPPLESLYRESRFQIFRLIP